MIVTYDQEKPKPKHQLEQMDIICNKKSLQSREKLHSAFETIV